MGAHAPIATKRSEVSLGRDRSHRIYGIEFDVFANDPDGTPRAGNGHSQHWSPRLQVRFKGSGAEIVLKRSKMSVLANERFGIGFYRWLPRHGSVIVWKTICLTICGYLCRADNTDACPWSVGCG